MGDISEHYRNQEMDYDLEMSMKGAVKIHSPDFTWWRPQVGKKIKLTKMEISHIKNCIAMIERRHGWREQWLRPLQQELKSRK